MAKLDKETKVLMADFLDSLRDYMHESHNLLCFDERESDDFVDTYEKQLCEGTRQQQSGRHLTIPVVKPRFSDIEITDKAIEYAKEFEIRDKPIKTAKIQSYAVRDFYAGYKAALNGA